MNLNKLAAAALLAAASLGVSAAPLVAADNFDGYAAGAVAGNNGGSGWGGAWAGSVATVTGAGGDNMLAFGGDHGAAAYRTLGHSISGTVLVDFTVRVSGALQRNDFLGLWFGNSASGVHTGEPNLGLKGNRDTVNMGAADVFGRLNSNAGAIGYAPGSNLAADTDYRIVALMSKSGGGSYDRMQLWLDPVGDNLWDFGAGLSIAGNSGLSSFNMIGFRTANIGGGPTLFVDDLRISEIPEPGSLVLAATALLGLGLARRRRD